MQSTSPAEANLKLELIRQPFNFSNRFTSAADCHLRRILFRSLAAQREDYLRLFFPHGTPQDPSEQWSLRLAQGAVDGAEYTAAAKGTACGHIFKNGESTYHCKTCEADETCVLCSKCFESSDHEGHMVLISVSPGNSGCCDCGDPEAWKKEVRCTIHTADTGASPTAGKASGKEKGKGPADSLGSQLPPDLVWAIRMTIARSIDYLCDVFSCSPEQLRLPKSATSILQDERLSRLSPLYGDEPAEEHPEFALVLWNDEKHTVDDVQNQVARACRKSKKFGFEKAMEVNDIGRSVVQYSTDVSELLGMAEIIEQLKVTVTIRSARDTFREHMCATIIDWISDIANCAVGNEPYLLRNIVCEELLNPWRTGSQASNKDIGQAGIDDHETEDNDKFRRRYRAWMQPLRPAANVIRVEVEVDDTTNDDDDDENDDDEDYDEDYDDMDIEDDGMEIEIDEGRAANMGGIPTVDAADMDIDILDEPDDVTEALEATLGGYPPPPPPPPRGTRRRILTPADSDDGEADQTRPTSNAPYENVPQTPKAVKTRRLRPSKHWLEKPEAFKAPQPSEPREDLWQRVRLDYLILYDLRLWKILRIHLRHLYITTVVTIPHFKRVLGLRFAGLYTALAQLYLIADREPDHSIINLSVQMLTTPTITQEVVERGNFLTNLMAILYTFITTRQVGFPEDVNMRATLAFDAGAVTNRRMFHFFMDLRWLFQSEFVHYKLRFEPRYLLQFIDLVKLHQGVCPNVRATGEHVEYESDAWISASMIVKEVNKLCKQLAVAFEPGLKFDDGNANLERAIRTVAQVTMISAFGYERKRFHAAEHKNELSWDTVGPLYMSGKQYIVPFCEVQSAPMSFHHPLHYLLSWLLENGKSISRQDMRTLLHFAPGDLKDPWNVTKTTPPYRTPTSDELLVAIFDHPLRVCAWLAQMKAGLWVRNGITLRHQAHTYRSVSHRDVGYQRDIFMVQAGLVLCGSDEEAAGERFLAQMIHRWQLDDWTTGRYSGFNVPCEESQHMDMLEDFFHLLVIALSERGNLLPRTNEQDQHDKVLQHDIAHALCFKPLSFSELAGRVTEKVGESDDFSRVLESMTVYRAPEGLSDTGTFELKPEFIELVDPYYAHYSRNHREEAENIYKKHIAKKTGQKAEDVVYEPRLEKIEHGMFADLGAFTKTRLFVQLLGAALDFAATNDTMSPEIPVTRIETFLHMVLHLTVLALIEERSSPGSDSPFSDFASSEICGFHDREDRDGSTYDNFTRPTSLVKLLAANRNKPEYTSCHPTIQHILEHIQQRQPEKVSAAIPKDFLVDRSATDSPAALPAEEKERKKQEALARQAKIMAQMKQQQNNFLQNQGLSSFEDDFDDLEDDMSVVQEIEGVEPRRTWHFPTGNCILCQEETDDQRLYGTFAFLGESNILRSTPIEDEDYLREVINTPTSLDRSAEQVRPFGVAGDNKREVRKVGADGKILSTERQGLSKGFPHQREGIKGPVTTSCGHIMHFNCFELYLAATNRRHSAQIARNHPERIDFKEFVCPLCKALGNTFLPIIWKAKECAHEHELHLAQNFDAWLNDVDDKYPVDMVALANPSASSTDRRQQVHEYHANRSAQYVSNMFAPSLIQQNMQDLSLESSPASPLERRFPARAGHALSRLASLGMGGRGAGGIQSQFGGPEQGLPSEPTRLSDLWSAYRRVQESIKVNKLSLPATDAGAVNPVAALSRSLGLSVASFEITYRGVCSNSRGKSLVAELPDQVLTHLRIISETVESYLAVNVMQSESNGVVRETVRKRDIMTAQLFGTEHQSSMIRMKEIYGQFLFQDDIFLFFADWLCLMAPTVAEAASMLQLCFWAEMVKSAFVLRPAVTKQSEIPVNGESDNRLLKQAIISMGLELDGEDDQLKDRQIGLLRQLLDKYALAFLRKCAVLMLVRYGLEFECPYDLDPDAPELHRLTSLLHMPTLDEICAIFVSKSAPGLNLRFITSNWLHQAIFISENEVFSPSPISTINVPHPAIFELVGLPMNYDVLTEEAIRRRCPTTGKELSDPAVCLLCGEIFCSQAFCCMKDKSFGGCHEHMKKHDMRVGVFINIRKCMVLFSHDGVSGSWAQAPYLDRHGEPDPTLRRHHQLYLNQKRYDKLLRDVWLNHMIPSVISRKLEGDINPGGWETL
ncbi:unnamed protein product [Zymoseptoria tritici ST99CH_1A5]|uniref:E3 ubiquitin-protein ligase n=3 Tax=Zymoseptoria tritici TaxID=1047171 RepID=A0A1X7RWE0_ZYMT9|nr:unnamed protein product [Zymoseptoria tritici ST99CH_3D7]SMR53940.1 unnamed protein product [Zymoseptoria tritici ST99CH_1E4]SMR56152.1 unnamed protein product [Zymoseptoria tritici ST99CH_3D1]SMY25335.1 unnamed protein product [Zymoseptoria tritici ST99CH_1A5]